MISVALKTPLNTRLGIYTDKTSHQHRPDEYIGFTPSCSPHILQQNCAHAFVANSCTVALEKDFKIVANGARVFMGHCLCGVETRAMEPELEPKQFWMAGAGVKKF